VRFLTNYQDDGQCQKQQSCSNTLQFQIISSLLGCVLTSDQEDMQQLSACLRYALELLDIAFD
jgi:hypothetical protein